MFVITAMTGSRFRNDASDSSASTTMNSPCPSLALAPAEFRRPPITKVGSRSPAARMLATRLVVVVLPCVPATAMPRFRRISSASIKARGTTGMRLLRAAITSGLLPATAVDVTMASTPSMFSALWPCTMHAPSAARRCVVALSARSDPLMR